MRKILLVLCLMTGTGLISQTTDANGKKQGYWKKKDEKTNRLIYEGTFKDDKPQGKFKYYYPNDSIRAIMYFKNNGQTAYAKLFHLSGKRMAEGRYLEKEMKDSVWTYYDEAGVLISREKYVKGKKEGTAYVYFPDSTGLISEERNFKNNLQDGVFKQYFGPKKLRAQGNYLKGQLDGKATYYFPNGVEAATGYYVNGLKNGVWIYKEKNGKIKDKELYKNGVMAGKKETDEFFSKKKPEENKAIQNPDPGTKNNLPKAAGK